MSGNYPAGVTGNEPYFNPSTAATCHECGISIAAEQEPCGISRDGERHCCYECMMKYVIRLSSLKHTHYDDGKRWGGSAAFGRGVNEITVEVFGRSQAEALKRAEDYGQMVNEGVNAYIEEG